MRRRHGAVRYAKSASTHNRVGSAKAMFQQLIGERPLRSRVVGRESQNHHGRGGRSGRGRCFSPNGSTKCWIAAKAGILA
jgi:hypothetical protein